MNNRLVIALLGLMLAAPVFATGNHNPKPPTTTPPAATSSSTSSADAAAAAKADAAALANSNVSVGVNAGGGAGGKASATGGSGGNATSAGGSSSSTMDVSSNDRSNFWVLPAPMYAPPMAAVPCPSANVDLKGGSVLWSAASGYHHKTDSSDCTLLQIRNAKVEQCQYASAKQIEDMLVQKYLPGYAATTDVRFVDLTPEGCAALKKPVVQAPPVAQLLIDPAPVAVAPAPCRKGQKRNSKGVCYTPRPAAPVGLCVDGGKPSCPAPVKKTI